MYPLMTDNELLDLVKTLTVPGIFIDIDDTLSKTWDSWNTLILNRFSRREKISDHAFTRKYGKAIYAPYFANDPDVKQWLGERRECIESHRGFRRMPFATDAMRRIDRHGLPRGARRIAGYLTARSETMYEVTRDWLAEHGFPAAPITLSPKSFGYSDSFRWKAGVVQAAFPHVRGIIDDSFELAEEIAKIGIYKGVFWLFRNPIRRELPLRIISYSCHSRAHEFVLPHIA